MRGVQTTELRPLGAGEMLDRAITLFVRRFAPIAAVIAIAVVPVMVMSAILEPQSASALTDLVRMGASLGDPEAARRAVQEMSREQNAGNGAAAFADVTLSMVFRLVMWCALVRVVSRAYAGAATPIGEAYAFGLRRFVPLLIVALAFIVIGTMVAIPVMFAYVALVLAVVALVALHVAPAAIVVGIVGGLAVIGAAVVLGSTVFMTYELASVAVVAETANPAEAIAIAFRRALGRGMKRRTLIGGIVVFLVSEAGAIPVLAVGALLSSITHVPALYYAAVGAGTLLLDGLVASFVIVFSVDTRVRREGYDLHSALAG